MINSDHPHVDAARVDSRLWIGSHPPVAGHCCGDHPAGASVDLRRCGFTCLILCAEEYQPPGKAFPGVKVVHAPFDDDPKGLDQRQLDIAVGAVEKSVDAHDEGHRVLVTCMAGRNRSGLVTAWALSVLRGIHPAQAGQIVRDRRGLAALTNPSFRSLLQRTALTRGNPAPAPCELCEAAPVTRRYHEDAICWIADCKQCRVPMAVYREHGVAPPPRHLAHMRELLFMCGRPGQAYKLDNRMETIPDHYHEHLRPA